MVPKCSRGLSDNYAPPTTSTMVTGTRVFGTAIPSSTSGVDHRSSSLLFLVVLPDLPDKITERLIDVDTLLGRGLDKFASEMFGKVTALVHANLTLVFQIALVRYDNNGERILVLHTEDLLVECADFFERVAGGDRIYEKETLSRAHVLLTHGTVLLLSSRVQNIEQRDLLINDALLPVGVFDGWVVLVHEVALDELNRQGRLANTTTADYDKLILAEELGPRHQ